MAARGCLYAMLLVAWSCNRGFLVRKEREACNDQMLHLRKFFSPFSVQIKHSSRKIHGNSDLGLICVEAPLSYSQSHTWSKCWPNSQKICPGKHKNSRGKNWKIGRSRSLTDCEGKLYRVQAVAQTTVKCPINKNVSINGMNVPLDLAESADESTRG